MKNSIRLKIYKEVKFYLSINLAENMQGFYDVM